MGYKEVKVQKTSCVLYSNDPSSPRAVWRLCHNKNLSLAYSKFTTLAKSVVHNITLCSLGDGYYIKFVRNIKRRKKEYCRIQWIILYIMTSIVAQHQGRCNLSNSFVIFPSAMFAMSI